MAEAAHFGLKRAWLVVAATVIVQLGGSLLLILGRIGWLAASALGVFTALASLIAHLYWTITDPVERFHALNTFLEHIGMLGGFMLAAIPPSSTQAPTSRTGSYWQGMRAITLISKSKPASQLTPTAVQFG